MSSDSLRFKFFSDPLKLLNSVISKRKKKIGREESRGFLGALSER